MLKEFIGNHMFMSGIFMVGAWSILLQGIMAVYVKGYVRASANMNTTKKKMLIQLKNQFEAMHGMDCQVKNTVAYVDKFLLKVRFIGMSFETWEKIPYLSAGIAAIGMVAGNFYSYLKEESVQSYIEILFAFGIVLECLFLFYHIYGIKSKKQQIQIQLVDYLENYMTNRLVRVREGKEEIAQYDVQHEKESREAEEDMQMLKRLLLKMEQDNMGKTQTEIVEEQPLLSQIAASEEYVAFEEEVTEEISHNDSENSEDSELELLEEFVHSFLG